MTTGYYIAAVLLVLIAVLIFMVWRFVAETRPHHRLPTPTPMPTPVPGPTPPPMPMPKTLSGVAGFDGTYQVLVSNRQSTTYRLTSTSAAPRAVVVSNGALYAYTNLSASGMPAPGAQPVGVYSIVPADWQLNPASVHFA